MEIQEVLDRMTDDLKRDILLAAQHPGHQAALPAILDEAVLDLCSRRGWSADYLDELGEQYDRAYEAAEEDLLLWDW